MTTVNDVLNRLTNGTIDTEQAAAEFAAMRWPVPPTRRDTLAQIVADPDPEPDAADSFSDVEQAYVSGDITDQQYERFVQAVSQR